MTSGGTTETVSQNAPETSLVSSQVTTGRFLDSAVSGLYYETDSLSGFTDINGSFSYRPGEQITFYLGRTLLGDALAQEEVTPLDLIDAEDKPDKLQNMLRVLQTIDSDSDPSNGISISDSAHDYLAQFPLPLNEPATLFEANGIVQDMIAAVTNGVGLKDALSAFEHFHATLLASRRQTDDTVVLDLLGTKWDGVVRSSACPETATAELTMRFTPYAIVSTGYHSLDEESCTPQGYGIRFETYESSVTFTCANQCLDSDLNRVVISRDQKTVTTLSHQTGSDRILLSIAPEMGASSTLALHRTN
ncbi:MAG: hypothetical protein CML06_04635 [Pseudomonadales bacterium]|nr:hypothetical protein [Pseudomonadales bacterium]